MRNKQRNMACKKLLDAHHGFSSRKSSEKSWETCDNKDSDQIISMTFTQIFSPSSTKTWKSSRSAQTNECGSVTSLLHRAMRASVSKTSNTRLCKLNTAIVARAIHSAFVPKAEEAIVGATHSRESTHSDYQTCLASVPQEVIADLLSSVFENVNEREGSIYTNREQKYFPKPDDSHVWESKRRAKYFIPPQPNAPSQTCNALRGRNMAKPDPAEGSNYAVLDQQGNIIGDMRDKMGYLCFYNSINTCLVQLQSDIQDLVNTYFGYDIDREQKASWLENLDQSLSGEFIRYAGFIGVGGPCAIAGWEEIFVTPELRVALVAGVIWLVLKQQVFASPWFGASKEQYRQLRALEESMTNEECGFMRNNKRVDFISAIKNDGMVLGISSCSAEKQYLAASIHTLLAPFLKSAEKTNPKVLKALLSNVDLAVKLHHSMCLDKGTIYSFAPMPKDWPFGSKVARFCSEAHRDWLFDETNRASTTVLDDKVGLDKKKISKIHRYVLLSRIVVFEPLEAYRKGGWRAEDRDKGLRKMLICKGAVACRWGATRKFGKEKPSEGTFVELKDCRGKLGQGFKWWTSNVADPALAATNVPILGTKGEGQQPELFKFQPRWHATI